MQAEFEASAASILSYDQRLAEDHSIPACDTSRHILISMLIYLTIIQTYDLEYHSDIDMSVKIMCFRLAATHITFNQAHSYLPAPKNSPINVLLPSV